MKTPGSKGKKAAEKQSKTVVEPLHDDDEEEDIQMFSARKRPAQEMNTIVAKSKASPSAQPLADSIASSDANSSRKRPPQKTSEEEGGSKRVKGLLGEAEVDRNFAALGLDRWLVNACETMGLKRPTDVQWNCIPAILQSKNVLASAQTGSGKTAAFALPILQLLSRDPFGVFALVLTPTRELAFQIRDQFVALGTQISLRESVVVGGLDMLRQAVDLARRPHVVIATPGRLCDHVKSSAGVADALRRVRFLVLDEADRLLEPCFEPALEAIMDVLPPRRATLLFSATLTASLAELQAMALPDCVRYAAGDPARTVDSVVERYCHMPIMVKDCYLVHLVRGSKAPSLIVFTATRKMCQYLLLLLLELGVEATALHSGLRQNKRLISLDKFKGGRSRVLVATDVASRGLDIPAVDLVINYDIPKDSKDYIHRVGRTARAGRQGTAISLVTQFDVKLLHNVEEATSKKLEDANIPEDDVLPLMTEVMKAKRLVRVKLLEMESEGQDESRRGGLRKRAPLEG